MSRLIRFEDAYGMADLVCLAQDMDLIALKSNPNTNSLEGINCINYCEEKDTYYECGISFPTLLLPTNELLANIKAYNITELVLVYDMDSPKASDSILSVVMLSNYLQGLRQELDAQGCQYVEIKLVPVVWSAETFALYILANDYKDKLPEETVVEPTELVHSKNTAKFHGKIVEIFLNNIGVQGKTKHLREYISQRDKIIVSLENALEEFEDSINFNTIAWIISEEDRFLYDIKSAIQHQNEICTYHTNHQPNSKEVLNVCGISLDMNKKCW